jgi:alkaline phosphatase
MVPLFAYGPGSARFSGIQDNAQVGRTLIELLLKKEFNN